MCRANKIAPGRHEVKKLYVMLFLGVCLGKSSTSHQVQHVQASSTHQVQY